MYVPTARVCSLVTYLLPTSKLATELLIHNSIMLSIGKVDFNKLP